MGMSDPFEEPLRWLIRVSLAVLFFVVSVGALEGPQNGLARYLIAAGIALAGAIALSYVITKRMMRWMNYRQ